MLFVASFFSIPIEYVAMLGSSVLLVWRWCHLRTNPKPIVHRVLIYASFMMGLLITAMSNVFNNHPALMIGTITLTEMNLDPITLKSVYLASIIGSDIGSLLLPIGTLALLIWMHILKRNRIKIRWKDYLNVSLIIIPPTVIVTLLLLYFWIEWLFR